MRILMFAIPVLLLSCAPHSESEPAARAEEETHTEEPNMNAPLRYETEEGSVRVTLVKQPYHGGRNVPELSRNPDYLEEGGLARALEERGALLDETRTVTLTDAEAEEYGEWHRLGLANGHLAEIVAENEREGRLTIGLLTNCNALLGMLGGFQQSGGEAGGPRRVGLVWIDAHGDFNTPETTLSGMLGGMPVAVAAGLALHRLRRESGMEAPLATEDIVMAGVRDLDPEERELVQEHRILQLTTEDLRRRSPTFAEAIKGLAERVELIYVHVDMDVLDPAEVPGHGLTVPGGPTSEELAGVLREIFRNPKVAGIGLASTPAYEADPEGVSRMAAYRLIGAAVEGVQKRGTGSPAPLPEPASG